jgi:tetratricopeptide (TPR) repeat protein
LSDVDPRVLLREGDALVKRGDVHGAIACFERVAEHYRAQGFILKAIAIYKQIVALDPERHEIAFALVEGYAALGLKGEAVRILEGLSERVEGTTLIAVLGRIIGLRPDHPARARLAELTSRGPFR